MLYLLINQPTPAISFLGKGIHPLEARRIQASYPNTFLAGFRCRPLFGFPEYFFRVPFTLGTVTLFMYLDGTHARACGARVPGGVGGTMADGQHKKKGATPLIVVAPFLSSSSRNSSR